MNRTDLQEREAERHRGPRPSARLPAHCRSEAPPSVASNALRKTLRRSGKSELARSLLRDPWPRPPGLVEVDLDEASALLDPAFSL